MSMINNFNDFVNELKESNSRTHKLSVLEKYKDNEEIKFLLNFLYNPYITTGIAEKKLNKYVTASPAKVFQSNDLQALLTWLSENNTGTDNIIAAVQLFRNNFIPMSFIDLFNGIVTKNLPLGIDAKTINKAIPKCVPEFNVQLANKYFDKPERIEGKTFVLTTKIDGGRIIALKENGKVSFYTRQGQEYLGLVDLENEMKNYLPDNTCLDGELTLLDPTGLESKEQYKATMKISRTDGEKHGLKMLVFDYMTAEEFRCQQCHKTYDERRTVLAHLFNSNLKYFSLLPILYQGTDANKITELLEEVTSKGEEGLMINVVDAIYDFKRSNNLLKVKKFQDTEVEVIDFEEGTNKNIGTLGALVCKYKNNTVKVGSGFTDEERDYIWTHKDEYLNKLITVKYFEESYDSKTNLPSLRFPIFMRLREI